MATTKALELGQFGTDLTVDDSTGAVTIANDITVNAATSTGIDDNADQTVITIDNNEKVTIAGNLEVSEIGNNNTGLITIDVDATAHAMLRFQEASSDLWRIVKEPTNELVIDQGAGNIDFTFSTSGDFTVHDGDVIIETGGIKGPSVLYIDPATYDTDSDAGSAAGTVRIRGDLIVDGDTTTINSTTLTVADLKIVVAEGAAVDTNGSSAAADGAGLYVVSDTSPVASFSYNDLFDSWASSNELRFPNNNGVFWDIAAGGGSIGLKGDTSDNITFRTNGNWDRLVVASTGKVGVATTDPIQKLDINGSMSLSNSGTASRFIGFYSNVVDSSTNDLSAFVEKNGDNLTIYNDDDGDVTISNNATSYIKITGGFVGVGPNHSGPTAPLSILTTGATGGPNTLAFNVINNGNQFDINGLAAYNDTTGYDVVQKASLTYHGRGQTSGNITTNVSGSSGGTHTNRFVNLNSPQTVSPMSQDVYYQYSGSGNTNTEMAVSEDQILKHVSTYNGGGVDTKFIKYANGDNWIKGSYRSDDLRHSVQPSLNLDFANTKQLDSRINFLRDSIGTYFDQDGVMRYAGINEPRFDHDPITGESLGLLIEEDRQNNDNCSPGLFTWSDLNTKREHNTNETLAPDGTFSATKVRCTPSTGVHRIAKYVGTIGAGQVTFSVYAKAGTATLCLLRESNITGVQGGGAITGGEHVGNGWYRLSIEYTDNGSSNYYPSFYIGTTSTSNVTTTGEEYIYLWGAQVELSEHRSSLIPTLKSMVYDNRSSAATYHDADGNLRTAPRDTLRYSHHYDGRKWIPTGPLLEDSAVNEVGKTTYMFANPYSNGNYNLDAYDLTTEVTSPDGSYTASKVFSTNSSTFNYSSHYSLSAAFSNGTVHVNSIYAKMGTVRYLWMSMPSTSEPSATFDLQDGVVARTGAQLLEAGMIDVGNGWYRCYTIGVVAGSPSQSAITVSLGTTNSNRTANSGDYVYLWGKQIEIDKLTSHMPNHLSTSQTIRSADVGGFQKAYRMNDIVEMYDVGHLIGNDVGTVYTHWQTLEPNDGFGGVFEIWDSGTNGIDQRFTAYYLTNNYSVSYAANPEQGVFRKTALAYDSSSTLDSQSVINGALQSVNTVHTWNMNLTRIRIGSIDLNAAYQLNGHIKEFRLYKDRLTNPELIALTEND